MEQLQQFSKVSECPATSEGMNLTSMYSADEYNLMTQVLKHISREAGRILQMKKEK